MSQQSGQKANATSNIQSSANETNKESYLAENIPLENGLIVRKIEGKWITTLGDTAVTDPTDNYNGQLEQIDDLNYELIIKIIIHVVKSMKKIDELNAKKTEIKYDSDASL